jgi:hypothetical protein
VVNNVPMQGDIIKINLDPKQGHEQKGYRPYICLSHHLVSDYANIAIFAPISNTIRKKSYFFLIVFVNLCPKIKRIKYAVGVNILSDIIHCTLSIERCHHCYSITVIRESGLIPRSLLRGGSFLIRLKYRLKRLHYIVL